MKYYVSTAFLNTGEVVEIAKAADDLGYDGMGIPDHVINLETLQTPYPYTKDGERRWEAFTDWPDPWVIIGAIALVTTRLRFVTTVYLPAMRDPYSAANRRDPRRPRRTARRYRRPRDRSALELPRGSAALGCERIVIITLDIVVPHPIRLRPARGPGARLGRLHG